VDAVSTRTVDVVPPFRLADPQTHALGTVPDAGCPSPVSPAAATAAPATIVKIRRIATSRRGGRDAL
jgi:hypothetical protein